MIDSTVRYRVPPPSLPAPPLLLLPICWLETTGKGRGITKSVILAYAPLP